MFKKLLSFVAILLIISCQSKTKITDSNKDIKITEQQIIDDKTPYQTIENADQAADLNKAADDKIQEVEVQDRVFFDYNSSSLNDEAKKILSVQVEWLKSDSSVKITIEGHCDERGTREYNIALGEKRANAAKNYLTSNGVEKSRIKTISFGKERPAFFGTSDEVIAKNRRAVTVVN
jgi:peptidoglycan-associated lipoprotein